MAVLNTIANKKVCGGVNINTGNLGCQIEFGTPLHSIGMRKGFKIPAAQDFNIDYINERIQAGDFIPFIDASSFEDLSAEDAVSTNSAGVERLNLRGLPKYRFVFEEGHEFYRELSKATSFKSLDFIVGDELGQWKMAVNKDGSYGGFEAGQVVAQLTSTKVQGGDPESKGLTVQFLDRIQWDREYDIFTPTQLGFQPNDIAGVNGVTLTFDQAPSNEDTTIVVKAVLNADNNTPVTGLAIGNFLYTDQGAAVTPSAISEANGVYTLTVTAVSTSDVLTIKLRDTTASSDVIISNGVLYKSNTATATTVA